MAGATDVFARTTTASCAANSGLSTGAKFFQIRHFGSIWNARTRPASSTVRLVPLAFTNFAGITSFAAEEMSAKPPRIAVNTNL